MPLATLHHKLGLLTKELSIVRALSRTAIIVLIYHLGEHFYVLSLASGHFYSIIQDDIRADITPIDSAVLFTGKKFLSKKKGSNNPSTINLAECTSLDLKELFP